MIILIAAITSFLLFLVYMRIDENNADEIQRARQQRSARIMRTRARLKAKQWHNTIG